MLTLRSGLYTESDLNYLIRVIQCGECEHYDSAKCDSCNKKRACDGVRRLKRHVIKLIGEYGFNKK